MRKELIISTVAQETRVGLLEDDELVEFMIERRRAQGIVGNIYKGRVTKVLPGMQSAFVNIGLERDAFLYVSDFVEDGDEYDRIVSSAEAEALEESPAGEGASRTRPRTSRREGRPAGDLKPRSEEPRPRSPAEAPRPAETPSPRSGATPGEEQPFGLGSGPERPEGDRRTERRPRRGRIPSFESREDRPSGGLEVLPGETLAKYRRTERAAGPGRGEASEIGEPDADEPTPPDAVDEVAEQTPPAPEAESEDIEAGQGNTDSEDPGDGPSRARIYEPPRSGEFSRKPVRRPRRRGPSRPDGPAGPSAEEPTISDLLRPGQEILVQVSKEPLGKKGARITSHIALPGRYLVYLPTVDHIGVSRKISTEDERARLRQIINDNRDGLPGGFIVRTAAEGRDESEFVQDLRFLADLWKEIRDKGEETHAPALMHSDLNLVQKVLRDQLTDEFRAIRLDNELEYTRVLEFVSRFQPSLVNRVRLHLKDTPILEEYGLQQEIDKAMKSKVWLKSGGYIVVNQTEALVAIDVNTGKFVGKSNRLEDTIVRTNLDAVHEIVRQIRLRNLGGIIVVDFIDMEERKNRQRVMQALEEELRKDRSPSKILQFNDFGLVAITRKRTQPSLEKVLGRTCPRCSGAGFVKAIETVCYEIQQEVGKMLAEAGGRELTVRVNPEIARAIKSGEFVDFSELEEQSRAEIRIQADAALDAERFDIF